jgi:hypothetical protein
VRVRVIDDLAGLSDVRKFIDAHRSQLRGDYEGFRQRAGGDGGPARPFLIAHDAGGEVRSLLVGIVKENAPLPCRVGRFRIFEPRARVLEVEPGGLLGELDEAACDSFYTQVQSGLAEGRFDVALFDRIPTAHPLYPMLRERPGLLTREGAAQRLHHFYIDVDCTFEAYLGRRSRNTRRKLKQALRRLQERCGPRLELRRYRETQQAEEALAVIEQISAKVLHPGYTSASRAAKLAGLRRGDTQVFALLLDGCAVAFEDGVRVGDTFISWDVGFDPAFAELRVGSCLAMQAIRALCEDPAIRRIDLGTFDAPYKYSWCDEVVAEAVVCLYAPRLRCVLINAQRSVANAANQAAHWALKRSGAREFLRGWLDRRRRAGAGEAPAPLLDGNTPG